MKGGHQITQHDALCAFLEVEDENGTPVLILVEPNGLARPASLPEAQMYDLLKRLREWDVLNLAPGSGDDGPYWQGEIAKVIGARPRV